MLSTPPTKFFLNGFQIRQELFFRSNNFLGGSKIFGSSNQNVGGQTIWETTIFEAIHLRGSNLPKVYLDKQTTFWDNIFWGQN